MTHGSPVLLLVRLIVLSFASACVIGQVPAAAAVAAAATIASSSSVASQPPSSSSYTSSPAAASSCGKRPSYPFPYATMNSQIMRLTPVARPQVWCMCLLCIADA